MLSRNLQDKLCEIFMTLAELERNVEITRQVLTENKDYNSYQIFCYLDTNKKNKINDLDIFNFLREKNIFSTEAEIKLLILFYDNNLDTNLNLEEFINLIESKSSPRKEFKENNDPINFAIEYSLTKLLEKEIIYARKILSLFEDIKGFKDFNIHNIFHLIKEENNNCIKPQDLIKFLNKNYVSFIDNDIELIFNRLDKDKNNTINLCEFHLFFGFPYCEYNCPFLKCDFCGLEPCNNCALNDPCSLHKKSNFKNDENKNLNERTYKTYYTEFRNKNNKNNKNEEDEGQLNNGYQKISDNLILKLSPKREYAPYEICFDSNNQLIINNENENNKVNVINNDIVNNENINTINQNFEQSNLIKDDLRNKPNIINKENIFNNEEEILNNNIEINFKPNIEQKPIKNKYILNKNEYEYNQFRDYLRKAMDLESKIENLKIELSLRCDFNWEEIFRIFELEGRGFLSREDLAIGLNKFDLYPKDIDISLLLKRYDLKNERCITYPDFFEMIVPYSKYHRLMVENRRINSDGKEVNPDELNLETKNCIKNLFNEIIIGEFALNKEREKFSSLKKNFKEIFKLLDSSGKGFIGEKEFLMYIQNSDLFTSGNDCDLLFLRLNKLRNGKIEFQEMMDEIEPIY